MIIIIIIVVEDQKSEAVLVKNGEQRKCYNSNFEVIQRETQIKLKIIMYLHYKLEENWNSNMQLKNK